jgi:hypothetical protein
LKGEEEDEEKGGLQRDQKNKERKKKAKKKEDFRDSKKTHKGRRRRRRRRRRREFPYLAVLGSAFVTISAKNPGVALAVGLAGGATLIRGVEDQVRAPIDGLAPELHALGAVTAAFFVFQASYHHRLLLRLRY